MEVDEKKLARGLAQIRRSILLLAMSVQKGEKLTRDHLAFLNATMKEASKLTRELGFKDVLTLKTPDGEPSWPDNLRDVWEARK